MREAITAGLSDGASAPPAKIQKEASLDEIKEYRQRIVDAVAYHQDRADHIEELMKRNSANKWKDQKKQKMIRRLMTCESVIEQAKPMIEQVDVEIAKRES